MPDVEALARAVLRRWNIDVTRDKKTGEYPLFAGTAPYVYAESVIRDLADDGSEELTENLIEALTRKALERFGVLTEKNESGEYASRKGTILYLDTKAVLEAHFMHQAEQEPADHT